MKKYSFLVYHKDYSKFLEAIREQGVLHIKELGLADTGTALKDTVQLLNKFSDAIKFLSLRLVEKPEEKTDKNGDGFKVLNDLDSLRQEFEQAEQKLALLEKDQQQLAPWGEFTLQSVEKLKDAGWQVNFFSTPERKWDTEWETNFNAFKISQKGTTIYFVTLTKVGEELDIEADPVRLPQVSLTEINGKLEEVIGEKNRINQEYDRFAVEYIPALENAKLSVQQEFDFDHVVLNTNMAADDTVAVLEGFLPVTKVDEFEKFLADKSVYFESKNPESDERVPIVLKNNWFARLFEPIGELYSLPNHKELDLTALYAPFYWLFFGFCLGDAGYGLILTIVGFIASRKVKQNLKSAMVLIGFLGISTIIFGLISGTVFGMNLYEMRLGFYATLDDLLKAKDTNVNQALFNLALAFGGIQIIYGMFIKAANEIYQGGFRNGFSTIGWIIILFAFGANFLMGKYEVDANIAKIIFYSMLSIGFFGAFVFSDPKRSVFVNFGLGLWDSYNMATGLLGDLLSYIRLFALGISSGILGYVFNSLAISLSPDIPVVKFIVMALILVAGHGINLLMAMLGAFVHPMRLTFVEFYKNAGFSGGGRKYSPFKTKINGQSNINV